MSRLRRAGGLWQVPTLVLLLLFVHQAAVAAPAFDEALAGRVFTAALAFMTPRTLEPTVPAELTLWGLHGLSAVDPALNVELDRGTLRLSNGAKLLYSAPAPAPDDGAAWGRMAATLQGIAWASSQALRDAGTQGAIQAFFDELFNHLDPYSRYVAPSPAAEVRGRLSGDASAGLGLARDRGAVIVASLAAGGPGELAGVRVGDRLLAVGRHRMRGARLAMVAGWLAGSDGDAVTLRLLGLDGVTRDVVVALAPIPPESVFPTRDGNLLILRISGFSSNTAQRLSQVMEAGLLGPKPPGALVLDLRGNRGGLLRQAVTATALLVDQGVVASTAGRAPGSTHDWRIEGGDLTHGMPVLVLVDGRTASAAEIMAAALADLRRAVVMGSATLGKGLVQVITPLPDGGELFVTWSRVLAPLGWPIQGLGVMPQLCTSQGEAETARELADLVAGHQDLAATLAASRAARAPLPTASALEIRAACPAALGRDGDIAAAHMLAGRSAAYQSAILPKNFQQP